jgi:uncharacterized protein YndB with AHSA1/START domain
MKLEREIEIAAPAGDVYAKLTDPDCLGEWVTIQERLEERPEGDLEKGSKLVQRLKVAGKGFKVTWIVDEARPPGLVKWSGKGPMGAKARAVYEISANGDGTSTFTYVNEWDLPGGIAGKTFGAAIKRAAGREADRSLEALKKLLEGG